MILHYSSIVVVNFDIHSVDDLRVTAPAVKMTGSRVTIMYHFCGFPDKATFFGPIAVLSDEHISILSYLTAVRFRACLSSC